MLYGIVAITGATVLLILVVDALSVASKFGFVPAGVEYVRFLEVGHVHQKDPVFLENRKNPFAVPPRSRENEHNGGGFGGRNEMLRFHQPQRGLLARPRSGSRGENQRNLPRSAGQDQRGSSERQESHGAHTTPNEIERGNQRPLSVHGMIFNRASKPLSPKLTPPRESVHQHFNRALPSEMQNRSEFSKILCPPHVRFCENVELQLN